MRVLQRNREREVLIQTGDTVVKIPVSQILYIEKSKNYLEYYTRDQVYRIRGTIADVEDAFRKEGFSKCISGCLVNLKYVTKASKDTVWLSDITLPISRQRRNGFKEDLMRYMGGGY